MMTEVIEMSSGAVRKASMEPETHSWLRDKQRGRSLHGSPRRVLTWSRSRKLGCPRGRKAPNRQ